MAKTWIMIGLLAGVAGCGTMKLETGYEPTELGSASAVQRRGYYAPAFTNEARAAQADEQQHNESMHPNLPGGGS